MLKWEGLRSSDYDFRLQRAKILGGWLVRQYSRNGEAMTFVPDPDHKWDGSSLD
jgi:hypothetical protein